MRKLFFAALIAAATASGALAQEVASNKSANSDSQIPNMGRAPREQDGVGRLDLRVVDEAGNPVNDAYAFLESRRSNGIECASWNWTDARGVSVLPPIHMGKLKLVLKAKGYQTVKLNIDASSLDQPVRVTMVRKK
ncbi:MAG TPA: hypothetical protein VD968_08855 [Pyrinomonadaceae bacterium]|nr:hypothetical protein [Pyrinomonadaceae bacterium]